MCWLVLKLLCPQKVLPTLPFPPPAGMLEIAIDVIAVFVCVITSLELGTRPAMGRCFPAEKERWIQGSQSNYGWRKGAAFL